MSSYVPLALVKSLAQALIAGEGQAIIYRRVSSAYNTATGSTVSTNTDTPLRAVVGDRKSAFINGTLVRMPGEKLLISPSDLATPPQVGDVVILAASETAAARRRVVSVKTVGTQGGDVVYSVEVEP